MKASETEMRTSFERDRHQKNSHEHERRVPFQHVLKHVWPQSIDFNDSLLNRIGIESNVKSHQFLFNFRSLSTFRHAWQMFSYHFLGQTVARMSRVCAKGRRRALKLLLGKNGAFNMLDRCRQFM